MKARRFFLFAAVGTLAVIGPAHAQDSIVFQLQQKIIAERRLADDRELGMLRSQAATRLRLQRELSAARAGGAAARSQAARISRELDEAIKREKALLAQILQRDPASQILIADLESELSLLALSASPTFRTAMADFGSGRRSAAWPRIESIARNGSAREKRVAARLRMIMFNYQDSGVTAEDVRDRWLQASNAEPSNSLALAALAMAQQYLGDVSGALETLARAATVSSNATERHLIAWQRAAVAFPLQRPDLMVTLLREQLEAGRQLTGLADAQRNWMEAQTRVALAGFLLNLGRNAEAAADYARAAEILQTLRQQAPNWRFIDDMLASTLVFQGNVEGMLNKPDQASSSYGKAISLLEERIARTPADAAPAKQTLAQAFINSCSVKQQRGLFSAALPLCARALELQKEQPQSAARDFMLASNAVFVARLMLAAGELDGARDMLRYSVGLWRALSLMDPVPATLAGHADALNAQAAVDPTVCWRDVATAWKALEDAIPLNDFQKQAHLNARVNGRAGSGCDLTPPADATRNDP